MNESVVNDTWQWYREMIRSWLEDPGAEEHEGRNMSALKMDEAYMVGVATRDFSVYSVSDDCFRVSVIFFPNNHTKQGSVIWYSDIERKFESQNVTEISVNKKRRDENAAR